MNKEAKQKDRRGETFITSVSVSKEFQELVDKYDLSPTEVFRRGVAVTLYDMGVLKYNTELNRERSFFVKDFMEKIEKEEKLREDFEKIDDYLQVKKSLEHLKKALKHIHSRENT